jgi:molybdopterin molybdotransferase
MPADGCCSALGALSVDDVDALIQVLLNPVETETIKLVAAVGRVLAEPVLALQDMPPFDAAAMDGYALRRSDLEGSGPWQLPIGHRIAAGDGVGELELGHCARIFTGAPIPKGADSVVMQESVLRQGQTAVFEARPDIGSHIRYAGQDRCRGQCVLAAGRRLDAHGMLAAAAAGVGDVLVRRLIRVATVTTGAELRPVGSCLHSGQIWDANGPMLRAAFSDPAIVADHLMISTDNVVEQSQCFQSLANHDLIVTTGGVSVGEEDRLIEAILQAGGEARSLRVAIKPGQHLVIGKIGRAVVLGLPGNPVAAFVANRLFATLAVSLLLGADDGRRTCIVRSSEPIRHRPGRREYRPARFTGHGDDCVPIVELAPPDFAARSGWFGSADGLAILPEDLSSIGENEQLSILPL